MSSDFVMPLDDREFRKVVADSRRSRGSNSEFVVAAALALDGAFISFPTTSAPKYDLVADISGLMLRVQVKTMSDPLRVPTGSYRSYYKNSMGVLSRKYARGDFDLMAGVVKGGTDVFYVPEPMLDYSQTSFRIPQDEVLTFKSVSAMIDRLQTLRKRETVSSSVSYAEDSGFDSHDRNHREVRQW